MPSRRAMLGGLVALGGCQAVSRAVETPDAQSIQGLRPSGTVRLDETFLAIQVWRRFPPIRQQQPRGEPGSRLPLDITVHSREGRFLHDGGQLFDHALLKFAHNFETFFGMLEILRATAP